MPCRFLCWFLTVLLFSGAGADRERWMELQRNGMRLPLAWEHRIGEYVALYRRLAPQAA